MPDMTYAEVKAEIAARIGRDDLSARIATLVGDRIGHYRKEVFFSAPVTDTSITTVAGTKLYAVPAGGLQIVAIRLRSGGVWSYLDQVPYDEILQDDSNEPSNRSQPSNWAMYGNGFRLGSGAPDDAYPLELTMDTAPIVPPTDGTTNFWTEEEGAQSLIINSTCAEIFRTYVTNPIRKAEFAEAEERDYEQLENKTIRLMGSLRIQPHL